MTFSTDQFIYDRFLFRGTEEEISKLYDEVYDDCFDAPERVGEGIWELELRSENPEVWISKYPLTKATGFVLDWKDKYVIVAFSESGSGEITRSDRVHHFDGRKDDFLRWYYNCPITETECKFEEYYANVDWYDRFTYRFPFVEDWFQGAYADRLLSKKELDFVIRDGVLTAYRGNDSIVVIPEDVTNIESTAFKKCASNRIREIVLPDTVKEICAGTFSSFVSLESIVLPQSLVSIGERAFSDCIKLKALQIPDTVTEIGNGAFWWCSSLQKLRFPKELHEISDNLCCGCDELEWVEIPAGVKRLGSSAFSGCGKLNHIKVPDGVEEIGGGCFRGCVSLTALDIPNSITSLGRECFNDTPWYQEKKGTGTLMVGAVLLEYHTQESHVTIPEHIRIVAEYAFSGNKELMHLEFREGVESIKMCAFMDCEKLQEVICPVSLSNIGQHAFYNCPQLQYLYAPGVVIDNAPLGGAKFAHSELAIVMPRLNIVAQKNAIMKQALCRGFLLHPELDAGDAKDENVAFAIKQKKRMLPWAFAHDHEQVVEFYLKNAAPAKGKLESEFSLPAREAGAEKCLALIDSLCI